MENNNQSHHLLHSFCTYPGVKFETQQAGEMVVLVLRAHPVTQIGWIVNSLILFILLFVLNFIMPQIFNVNQILFINIFGIVIILSYAWFNFLSWFFNVGIITNRRVIDVDFSSVIYKEVSETRLNRIEDITSKSGGYLQSYFDYGDLFIQTAGTQENIEFIKVPHPSQAVQIINSLTGPH